jgi:hypothetical protein
LDLARERIIDLECVGSLVELETLLCTNSGKVIVSLAATANNQDDVVRLAERIVKLNTSQHMHVQPIVTLTEACPSLLFLDALENLGTRVVWDREAGAIESVVRLLAWRFSKRPRCPVPCFYLHYPDSDTLEVYLLGRIQRTQLMYTEKLGTLFEMMALGRRWLTTRQIAEELAIGRSSVKVYFDRLRDEYDAKRSESGIDVPGKLVFCSELHHGVWVHRLRAQILVLD